MNDLRDEDDILYDDMPQSKPLRRATIRLVVKEVVWHDDEPQQPYSGCIELIGITLYFIFAVAVALGNA